MESDAPPEVMKKGKSTKKKILLLVALVIYSLILLLAGFTMGIINKLPEVSKINFLSKLNNPNDPLYANLQGTIVGKVVNITGDRATLITDKGGTVIFNLATPIIVSEIDGEKLNQLGTTPDTIRLNDTGAIKIVGIGNGYAISSITYFKNSFPNLVPPTQLNKTATQSAKPVQKQ